jgi:signal transduction histidine kinase
MNQAGREQLKRLAVPTEILGHARISSGACGLTSQDKSNRGLAGEERSAGGAPRQEITSDEFALLLRITNRLNSAWELDRILEALSEDLRAVIPFDRMEYAVLEDDGYLLTTRWVKANYPGTQIPAGYAYRRTEPIDQSRFKVAFIDRDMTAYAQVCAPDHPVSLLYAEGIRSSLNCPLVVADEVKGCLFFNSVEAGSQTLHHLELIQVVAGHLAAIIEQSRLNDQLKAQNQALRDLEQSRLEFVASISHELRTPLTSVVGFASELRDRAADFSKEEISQFSSLVAAQSADVAGLVEDLLVITRAESGHLEVSPLVVEVGAEVSAVAKSISTERPDQQIVFDLEESQAWADPLRVRQIARNLISNAGRYGGGEVNVSVRPEGASVVLCVSDNGPGIAEKDRDWVFEAYGRSRGVSGRPGSVGLGLTVSRYLAEAMGGALTYERDQGVSSFILRLPRHQAELGAL